MGTKNFAGKDVEVNEEGYLVNAADWTSDLAVELAKEEGIELTEKHIELLEFLRSKVEDGQTLTIRAVGKSGIVDIKEFYKLFPGGPLKKASKIAGIHKPTSCV